ncbi:MAG: hypothetical protein ABIF71_06805, partial [Planctomycetota bacterium]
GVRGLVAGANHGSYTSLMMRQCLTCLSNHHSAPHAKWIGYLFTGTYLHDVLKIDQLERGMVEFPRELPGLLLIFIVALMANLCEIGILRIAMAAGLAGVVGLL